MQSKAGAVHETKHEQQGLLDKCLTHKQHGMQTNCLFDSTGSQARYNQAGQRLAQNGQVSRGVCYNFRDHGTCRHGDQCTFHHGN